MDPQSEPAATTELEEGKLLPSEILWAERYDFLLAKGYRLRPRYRPGWKASWLDKPGVSLMKFEDRITNLSQHTLDAERVSDGRPVFLKYVPKISPEIEIGQYLSSPELQKDPRNHACPLLDVLENENDPEHVILVIPLLRPLQRPQPGSVGECVDMVEQTLEDKTLGVDGQERAPELSSDVPYDPYKLDVYILGMAFEQLLITELSGADFVQPLIEYMTPKNPEERPSAAEALSRFREIKKTLTWRTLTQRTRPRKSPAETRMQKLMADFRYRLSSLWWTIKPKRSLPELA
ncbi:hypothetical protein FRB99_008153 [Tulasnella sp. 403]|nr:hypothetical protein FRB99_008153 [Tulasnella sp. 403]